MATLNPLEEIGKLQQQIEALKGSAVSELMARRTAIEEELKGIEAELEKLTGKPPRVKRPRAARTEAADGAAADKPAGKMPDLQELKALLAAAPDKTISLRRDGYDVRNVKIMAQANPHLLRMGGKGAWPEVTLLK